MREKATSVRAQVLQRMMKSDDIFVDDRATAGLANYDDDTLQRLIQAAINRHLEAGDGADSTRIQFRNALPGAPGPLKALKRAAEAVDGAACLHEIERCGLAFRLQNTQLYFPEMHQQREELFTDHGLVYFAHLSVEPPSNATLRPQLSFEDEHTFVHQLRGSRRWFFVDLEQYPEDNGVIDYPWNDALDEIDAAHKRWLRLDEASTMYVPRRQPHAAGASDKGLSIDLKYSFTPSADDFGFLKFVTSVAIGHVVRAPGELGSEPRLARGLVSDVVETLRGADIEQFLEAYQEEVELRRLVQFAKGA